MSRAYVYATIGVIWILAMMIHWFGVTLFAPGTEVYALAEPGIGTYIDEGWRDQMYTIFARHIPLLFVGASLIWGFAKAYEDALLSGRRR